MRVLGQEQIGNYLKKCRDIIHKALTYVFYSDVNFKRWWADTGTVYKS
jgi:hypothetical protein